MGTIIPFKQKAKRQESRIDNQKSCKVAEKDGEGSFKERYSHVFAVVPISNMARMQHFAKSMLSLVPDIFCDNDWDTRFDAWMDFCQFYITGFDPAYSRYLRENPNLEKAYQYKFEAMPAEKLEEELEDCLIRLLVLSPENSTHKKEILYQATRLFRLEEIISTLFYGELTNE